YKSPKFLSNAHQLSIAFESKQTKERNKQTIFPVVFSKSLQRNIVKSKVLNILKICCHFSFVSIEYSSILLCSNAYLEKTRNPLKTFSCLNFKTLICAFITINNASSIIF